jgi:hypothetical protein
MRVSARRVDHLWSKKMIAASSAKHVTPQKQLLVGYRVQMREAMELTCETYHPVISNTLTGSKKPPPPEDEKLPSRRWLGEKDP